MTIAGGSGQFDGVGDAAASVVRSQEVNGDHPGIPILPIPPRLRDPQVFLCFLAWRRLGSLPFLIWIFLLSMPRRGVEVHLVDNKATDLEKGPRRFCSCAEVTGGKTKATCELKRGPR